MHGEPTPFVLMFTIGNIIIIAGAFFYNGPYTQVLPRASRVYSVGPPEPGTSARFKPDARSRVAVASAPLHATPPGCCCTTQAKKMVSKQLCCATFSFLAAMCLTLVVAYSPGIKSPTGRVFLCLIFIFIQYVCQIWFVICSGESREKTLPCHALPRPATPCHALEM